MSEDPRPADPHAVPRTIDLSIEVPGTPEQVWAAIATGPGISSWYVPHRFAAPGPDGEPGVGTEVTAVFGPSPEMQVPGRVAAWEPPHRVAFDGGEGVPGLAFEWLVQTAAGGGCVVRLVASGFGSGAEWDDQYDGMTEGFRVFLANLRLHLRHFAGQAAASAMPTAVWPGPATQAWAALTRELGIDPDAAPGDTVTVTSLDAPGLAGRVADRLPAGLLLVLEQPCPGTALVLAEGHGEQIGVSVWTYLYGPRSAEVAAADGAAWQAWLSARAH